MPLTPGLPGTIAARPAADREVNAQINRLMTMLREFAGFRASNQIQLKLQKVFSNMPAKDFSAWLQAVEKDPQRTDLVALVEDLTNHETYFFREMVHLEALRQHVLPALVQAKARQAGAHRLVLWSAACSSGEEVYTLAMIALEVLASQGFAREQAPGEYVLSPGWSLEVHGSDISRQAIRLAKEAMYCSREDGLSSFRKFPQPYLRFFTEAGAPTHADTGNTRRYYKVKPQLARYCQFRVFNLVSRIAFLRDIDVVFCRNVLIYIDNAAQKTIVQMLADALQPEGVLFLGLVDAPETAGAVVKHALPQCVIYRKP